MMKHVYQEHDPVERGAPLVLPLSSLDRRMLSLAGGKAANLGALIQAGFAVPEGFCITTAAYRRVASHAGLETALAELETLERTDGACWMALVAIRTTLCQTSLPGDVVEAITVAYQALLAAAPGAVAVRSSATAEDLPGASFAGQQDTLLNVIGIEPLLAAVQQCFASLWTDRTVLYRARLGIAPRDVRLAVVVQRMVEAAVAGVLFTANPLTGKRRQAVIDANPGLGEAVVSGVTTPDHVVVQTPTGAIIERRLGEKQISIQPAAGGGTRQMEASNRSRRFCLSDEQIRTLALLGARVEALYETPQDIEWAIDAADQIFLLQARPITTLFPLPVGAPNTDEEVRVYLAFGVQQGTYRPFTPMGLSALRLLAAGFLELIGTPLRDPRTGPRFVTEAAGRPFFDVTAALRYPFGRRFLLAAMQDAEVHAANSFDRLVTDPRLSLRPTPRRAFGRALLLLLARTRLPWYLLQAFLFPHTASRRVQQVVEHLRTPHPIDTSADAAMHLAVAERLLLRCLRLAFRVSPVMLAGMQSFALARRLLKDCASESECQVVLGGSPINPTTQMNLALWRLSHALRADAASPQVFAEKSSEQLGQDYLRGLLPEPVQQGVAHFLQEYGHQSICELDLGVPRWSEEPGYVFALLTSYLQSEADSPAPDLQLQRATREADAMIVTLADRARRRHWLRGWLVQWCLRRAHALAGFREMTRFVVGLILVQAREHLWPVGAELARTGRLKEAADVFFLTLSEARAALAGADLREEVSARHAIFSRELERRHVPLVLLSDGTDPTAQPPSLQNRTQIAGTLQGIPASAGTVTGMARVIHDPNAATLLPGEVLVAPTTDPGWTPLFLHASGLVMDVGGAMAHGAIVAREYGIPAVVGVVGATERIPTGSRITVNGTTGVITIELVE